MAQHDITLLARLLAHEQLSIRRGGATASFDPTDRVLRLPVWSQMTPVEDEMLMIHEVGHALFSSSIPLGKHPAVQKRFGNQTPDRFFNVWNIIEDARIDRLMKSHYPGATPLIHAAYNSLADRGFFGDMTQYKEFIDRANLHFKLGVQGSVSLNLTFSAEEQVWLKRMTETISFDDAILLALRLFKEGLGANNLGDSQQAWDNHIKNSASLSLSNSTSPSTVVLKDADFGTTVPTTLQFQTFRSESISRVKMMHAEFVRQHAAMVSALTHEQTRGVLDLRRISLACIRPDVFQKGQVRPVGKRHGLFLILDRSASMVPLFSLVVQQVAMLISFCRLANIPYTITTFSTKSVTEENYFIRICDERLTLAETDRRMEIVLSPEMKKKYPMGSTPLMSVDNALLVELPRFRRSHDLDRTIVVFLTDGGATDGHGYHADTDPDTGRVYTIDPHPSLSDGSFCSHHAMIRDRLPFDITSVFWHITDKSLDPRLFPMFDQTAFFSPNDIRKDGHQCRLLLKKFIATIA